ncbi:hypothetical protein ACX8Z9_14535 [Arthrobacter halodurans]|uniref:DUF2530 domain-containing protein n=1 Tax=Arthrobacter halodurans TaxID=516699 RepID=A0ABV4UKV8_9MICC
MLPKRGQQWSYLDRGRTLAVSWGLTLIGGLAFGVYLLITRGDWLMVVLSLAGAGFLALYVRENEREHRVPTFDDEPESEDAPREGPLK